MSTVTVTPYVHPGPDPLEDIPVLPEEQATRRDVLLRAADLLGENGWMRCAWLPTLEGRPTCLLGALDLAAREMGIGYGSYGVYDSHRFIGPERADRYYGWNDRECQGGDHAAGVLRSLANGATWEEATAA